MIPILYPASETEFKTGGLGALVDCVSSKVTEERNGEFNCEFEYPIDAPMFPKIKPGCIVYVDHDASRKPQPFDIYAFEVSSDGLVTFRARHVSYRLQYSICHPTSLPNINLNQFMAMVCNNNRALKMNNVPYIGFEFRLRNNWYDTFKPDPPVYVDVDYDTPRTSRDLLLGSNNSVITMQPGEYKWDVWWVYYYLVSRGKETDTVIRYGINVPGLSYEYDTDETYHAAIPYWNGSDNPKYLTGDESFIDGSGVYADSDTIGAGETGDFYKYHGEFKGLAVDLTSKFKSRPTALKLLKSAEQYADENIVKAPYENFRLDYRALSDSPEYENYVEAQVLQLCDTATIVFPEIGLAKPMKVVKTTYNPLLERYDALEFGSVRRGIYTADSTANTPQYQGNVNVIDVDDSTILADESPDPVEWEEI